MELGKKESKELLTLGSHICLGNWRLAELLLTFVSKMILLAIVKTWQKGVVTMSKRRMTAIKAGRETTIIMSSRSKDRIERGVVSPGAWGGRLM